MTSEMVRELDKLDQRLYELESHESQSIYDPQIAHQMSIGFLQGVIGKKWIGGAVGNLNEVNGAVVSSMTYNSASEMLYQDATRGYPYLDFTASNEYLSSSYSIGNFWSYDSATDGTYVRAASRGITVGVWAWLDTVTANSALFSAWNANTTNAAWRLYVEDTAALNTNQHSLVFDVSSTGSFELGQQVGVDVEINTNEWVFCVGRWSPSVALTADLFMRGVNTSGINTTSIVSDLYDGDNGYIGNMISGAGANAVLDGRIGLTFFHGSLMTDAQVAKIYQMSRHIYGV